MAKLSKTITSDHHIWHKSENRWNHAYIFLRFGHNIEINFTWDQYLFDKYEMRKNPDNRIKINITLI